jgi:hypothetical protein
MAPTGLVTITALFAAFVALHTAFATIRLRALSRSSFVMGIRPHLLHFERLGPVKEMAKVAIVSSAAATV